jgi:hypothetical protein
VIGDGTRIYILDYPLYLFLGSRIDATSLLFLCTFFIYTYDPDAPFRFDRVNA